LTREFEHSLDIRSATKGQYVVKPQVSDFFSLDAMFSFILEMVKVGDIVMLLVLFFFFFLAHFPLNNTHPEVRPSWFLRMQQWKELSL